MTPWELARQAVVHFVLDRSVMGLPADLPADLMHAGGAFVCIKTASGALRGCIGTVESVKPTLGHEIIHNAIGAASRDPRFAPVSIEELADLRYTVDLIQPLEAVPDASSLDPRRYGIVVRSNGRTGVLLPDIPEIRDAATQLRLACRKAGIGMLQPLNIYRFEVLRCPSA